jgi:hypothetical protein
MSQEFGSLPIPFKTPHDVSEELKTILVTAEAVSKATQGRYLFDVTASPFYATGDGSTDDSAAVIAAIQAAYDAGGGIVYFPVGVYRIDSQITIPNAVVGANLQQPPITLCGAGTRWAGNLITGTINAGGSVLDLRFAGAHAKIVSLGIGTLHIEKLSLVDNGTSSTPFVFTTGTTLITDDVYVRGNLSKSGLLGNCDQDAFILGGVDSFLSDSKTLTASFRGWGTTIKNCKFSRIRRGVYGRAACNAVLIMNNTFDTFCGATEDYAALEFNKFGDGAADGNVLIGNLIEVKYYVYAIRFENSRFNVGFGNSFFDPGPQFIAGVRLVGGASGNMLLGSFGEPGKLGPIPTTNAGRCRGNWQFGGTDSSSSAALLNVKPDSYIPPEPTSTMLQVSRSDLEETDVGASVFTIRYDGGFTTTGRGSASPTWQISKSGSGNITIDHTSIVRNTGDLLIYPGNSTSAKVRIMRGVFVLNQFTTAGRPSATAASLGACYYDTTLNMPVFSDGTAWRDAAGNIV